jgi:hypothetical protein
MTKPCAQHHIIDCEECPSAEPIRRQTIIGTIVEAGTDEHGACRLIIETEPNEIKGLSDLPLYYPARITIERVKI